MTKQDKILAWVAVVLVIIAFVLFSKGNLPFSITNNSLTDQINTTDTVYYGVGGVGNQMWVQAQSFTPTQPNLSAITLKKHSTEGSPVGDLEIQIRTSIGNTPSTTILFSKTLTNSEWMAIPDKTEFTINTNLTNLDITKKYAIVIKDTSTNDVGHNAFNLSGSQSTYSGGNQSFSSDGGNNWNMAGGVGDLYFITYYLNESLGDDGNPCTNDYFDYVHSNWEHASFPIGTTCGTNKQCLLDNNTNNMSCVSIIVPEPVNPTFDLASFFSNIINSIINFFKNLFI